MARAAFDKKKAARQFRAAREKARDYLEEKLEETAPQREHLRREAQRLAPKVAAFALATGVEMLRNYRSAERPRRRRFPILRTLLLVAGAAAVTAWVLSEKN
jgi:hypothetical protein